MGRDVRRRHGLFHDHRAAKGGAWRRLQHRRSSSSTEGPRILTRVLGIEPAEVVIGMKVAARIEKPVGTRKRHQPLVVFYPAEHERSVMSRLRGKTAVVGLGYAGLGSSPGWNPIELGAMAAERALADAGLTLADVDGLCASTFYHFLPTTSFAEQLRIRPEMDER